MKSIFVGDLHASLKLPYARINKDTTTSDRLEDVLDVIHQVRNYAFNHEIRRVFILGDLFDQRHPDAPTLVNVARSLRYLIGDKKGQPERQVWLLPGNHDAHDRAGLIYSLGMFGELRVNGLNVAAQPTSLLAGGIEFSMIPWLPRNLFIEKVKSITCDPKTPSVLLFHQDVLSAVSNSYRVEKGIDPSRLSKWDCWLAGHIHTPQKIGSGRYIGAPLHLRFSDANDPIPERGFFVLDHTQLRKDPSKPDLALEMVKVQAPKFVRWRFIEDDDVSPYELAEDLLPELLDELEEEDSPTYLEIIIEGERKGVVKARTLVRQVLDTVERVEFRHIKVSSIVTDDGLSERIRKTVTEPGKLATPIELCRAFVDASKATLPEEFDADELINFAEGVMS